MALTPTIIRDLFDADGSGNGAGGGVNDPAVSGSWFDSAPSAPFINAGTNFGEPARPDYVYHAARDRLFFRSARVVSAGDSALAYLDPLFLDPIPPTSDWLNDVEVDNGMHVGEWDRSTGNQSLYVGLSGNAGFAEHSPITGVELVANAFPAVGSEFAKSPFTTSTDGYWDREFATSSGDIVFFESLGYGLAMCSQLRYQSTTLTDVVGKIFLDNAAGVAAAAAAGIDPGGAIPFGSDEPLVGGDPVPITAQYTSSPTVWQSPTFASDTFQLGYLQFVPDDDSTPAAPKGFLFMSATLSVVDGSTHRIYVKTVDFNPFNTPGTPTRVHKRVRLLSRVEIDDGDSAPNATGLYGAGHATRLFWHRPSRTIRQLFRRTGASTTPAIDQMQGIVYATTPDVAEITPATSLQDVETSRIVTFASLVVGSLGERIAGINVAWTLERTSTVDEDLNTVGLPATSTVANWPIDPVVGVAEGTLVVKRLGVPLTETTDYTVVLSTGVITWAGVHPDLEAGYTASYEHKTVGADPPHGTLQIASSQSDENGQATTRVEYPDNGGSGVPAGEFDKMTGTTT